jgi:hypothetical protein
MPYRMDSARFQRNITQVVTPFIGHGMIWRRYISGVSGVSVAGFGPTVYTADTHITGVVGVFPNAVPRLLQGQTPAGMIPAGETFITCQHRLSQNDEIIHQGATYRVDSEPQFVPLSSAWVALLKRATP